MFTKLHQNKSIPFLLGGALALMFSMGLWAGVIHAQANTPDPAATSGTQPTPSNITEDQVMAVARDLWCPLCSGVRLDSCELKACAQMRDMIATKLSQGENEDAIKAYFVQQYGPQVLGEPPRQGFNWLAWILPFAALVGGGVFAWSKVRQMMRPVTKNANDLTDGQNQPAPQQANGAKSGRPKSVKADGYETDEYTEKLEEELAKYG